MGLVVKTKIKEYTQLNVGSLLEKGSLESKLG